MGPRGPSQVATIRVFVVCLAVCPWNVEHDSYGFKRFFSGIDFGGNLYLSNKSDAKTKKPEASGPPNPKTDGILHMRTRGH